MQLRFQRLAKNSSFFQLLFYWLVHSEKKTVVDISEWECEMDPFRLEQEGMLLPNMTKFLHKRGWQDPYIPQPSTPLKFNIAPEKWWLEDCFPIRKVTFQGLC